ncbi:DUF5333 domain-containing protein [Ruegeria sp. HKCCA6948]|uniref:DUF5333 domain-containing protein n=1 Tax=unclassified Ruegeria TaxID=2625375 RepID=UPI0020C2A8BB|nr:DUF5333 domain-containing protein [Ruegeria sp. HKCCA6948]
MSVSLTYPASGQPLLLHSSAEQPRLGGSKTKGYVMSVLKIVALSAAMVVPAAADAKPPLRDVSEIDNELYYIAVANEISEYCPTISGRRLKAISVLWSLRSKANKLGYSDSEIRSYVESDAEKDRMRAKGEAYLADNGVTYEKPNSFCALGQKEIQRNSAIGVYLKAK